MPLLSIIVPVYNEVNTVRQILDKISAIGIDKEIIVVDDGSLDGTDRVLRDIECSNLKVIHHTSNRGKGAAFLTGLANACGEFVIIQDADLEYDPLDYSRLLDVIQKEAVDIALGARFITGCNGLFMHKLGNRALTGMLNFLFNSRLNDYATCYKLARRQTLNGMNLKASGFDIDVEIICSALKKGMRLKEVPVSYYPRTYSAGKKIRWRDGLWAMFYILKFAVTDF
ncbi:MAG: glycosyltransferase family 2 protein [Candidatus Omnitrophota bacterium]